LAWGVLSIVVTGGGPGAGYPGPLPLGPCEWYRYSLSPSGGGANDAPVEPGQLVAALAGYGVPVELIDCDLTDGDAVVSALGMRAAAR
jgi:hypothetical protein